MYESMKSLCCRVRPPQSQAISPVERDERTAGRGVFLSPQSTKGIRGSPSQNKRTRIFENKKREAEIGPRPAVQRLFFSFFFCCCYFSLIHTKSLPSLTIVRLLESPSSLMNCMSVTNNGQEKRVLFLTPYHPYPPPSRVLLNYKYTKGAWLQCSRRSPSRKPFSFFFFLYAVLCAPLFPFFYLKPFFIDAAGRYLSLFSTHLFCYLI